MAKKAFTYGHPLWQRAIEMRQGMATIDEIAAMLRDEGFDLTRRQVSWGLRSAPADAFLPTRTAQYLRRRFERASRNFNSYVSMRDLAMEALEKIEELEEELASDETSPLREQFLRGELYKWYGRAFEWSSACSEVALRIDERQLAGRFLDGRALGPADEARDGEFRELPQDETERERRARIDREQAELVEQFKRHLPSPPDDAIVRTYGGNNVKPPSDEDPEDDEDE